MEVRRYRASDHDEVWALHTLALEKTGAYAGHGPWDDDLHRIKEVYLGGGGEFLVGVYGKKIIAMGALERLSDHHAEIKRMRVYPDCQRQGFGQAVLEALEARARELGYETLRLDTTVHQVGAQNFYIKNGYAETGRTKRGRFDIIAYEKALHPSSN